MRTYSLDVSHIHTCLSCYVLDHCNGAAEMLVGVAVSRSTRHWQLKAELVSEVRAYGDKLPEDMPDSVVAAAIDDCFSGAHPLASFDSSLDKDSEDGESCYAWFRFTWSEESE